MAYGKKVGKFRAVTVLAEYNLDVRLDMEANVFTILVPETPGEAVSTKRGSRNFEIFRSANLEEVKKNVSEYLFTRDKTDFVDVIEYNYSGTRAEKHTHFGALKNQVGFEFCVSRVSVAQTKSGRAKLEIPINVDDHGNISVQTGFDENPLGPQSHSWHGHPYSMPFTVERWKKCKAIENGIAALDKLLFELLCGDDADKKLDLIGGNPLLLPAS